MPVPSALQQLLGRPEFWARFFWEESGADIEIPSGVVRFPASESLSLNLEISSGLSHLSLNLAHPGAPEGAEIAWDDQAHWHPHVLRWVELDLISRGAAIVDPEFGHPGIPLLLLCRFAPICAGDDAAIVAPLLFEAWDSLGILKDGEIQRYMEFIDHRQDGFRWSEGQRGWTITQDTDPMSTDVAQVYSLRNAENNQFPFKALEAYLDCLKKRVEAHPTPVARPQREAPELRLRYEIDLNVPEHGESLSRGGIVARAIDAALKAAQVGGASVSGGHSVKIGNTYRSTDTSIRIELRGDFERGIELLRRTLREMKAPRDITIEQRSPTRRPIPWWE